MSGLTDSIREWRAQEIRRWEEEKGFEEGKTVTVPTIGLLAAVVFAQPEEASGFIEKYLMRKLDLSYLAWNGRTNVKFVGVY